MARRPVICILYGFQGVGEVVMSCSPFSRGDHILQTLFPKPSDAGRPHPQCLCTTSCSILVTSCFAGRGRPGQVVQRDGGTDRGRRRVVRRRFRTRRHQAVVQQQQRQRQHRQQQAGTTTRSVLKSAKQSALASAILGAHLPSLGRRHV